MGIPQARASMVRSSVSVVRSVGVHLGQATHARLGGVARGVYRLCGPQSMAARTWPTARMVLWVAAILGGYLVFYYA